jgi:hypothetical protein
MITKGVKMITEERKEYCWLQLSTFGCVIVSTFELPFILDSFVGKHNFDFKVRWIGNGWSIEKLD